MDVVCTAGHVDHGKSTLVRALTGMEPDRWAEERRRGLTIDLGFAWTDLPDADGSRTVAFVDLPGHERFVPNMLAGAGPIRAALFVVAADEGWKPQSEEHLAILDLLEVTTGVVAVTKADSVDATSADAVADDVRRRLAGRSLANAPVVTVAATTGQGLDALRAALVAVLRDAARGTDRGRPRLWIDRAFTITGAGTVVTGTLSGGTLRKGDDVVLQPGGARARVRGLQSLKSPVDAAAPGDRVAVNLAGVERGELGRGHVLTTADAPPPPRAVDVWLRVLGEHRVTRRGAWHLHAGAGEWLVDVRPLHGSEVSGEGYARLQLQAAAPLLLGDRVVLREAGRRATLAGGIVVDTDPPSARGAARARRVAHLSQRRDALGREDRTGLLALLLQDRVALDSRAAVAAAGLPADARAEAGRAAGALAVGTWWVDPSAARAWVAAVVAALQDFHDEHPVDRAAPKDVALRAAIGAGCPQMLAPDLLAVLDRLGRVVLDGTGARLPGHGSTLDEQDRRARDQLLAALSTTPLSPPALQAAAQAAGASPALVRELEASEVIIRVAPDIAVTAAALEEAVAALRALYEEAGPFTAAQAKGAWDTTRKYALPLLEYLDRRGITARNGDVRAVTS